MEGIVSNVDPHIFEIRRKLRMSFILSRKHYPSDMTHNALKLKD
jgi:hypothetical protein